jgi:membrane-associated phospholipid phosphatase
MNEQRFAHYLSIVLIPPVVAAVVITALVYAWEHGTLFHRIVVWLTAVFTAGGLQITYVLYLRRMSKVSHWDVPAQQERNQPYLISAAISAVGLLLLLFLNASIFLWGLLWCFTVNTLLLYAINRRWKISAHMMGLTGPLIFLWPLFDVWLLLALPLIVLLGWARVTLRVHDIYQVAAGAAAGILLTLAQIYIILEVLLPLF